MIPELDRLIETIGLIPGIGRKSAQRIAFYFLAKNRITLENLSCSLLESYDQLEICENDGVIKSKAMPCQFCSSDREQSQICVVEQPSDVFIIENGAEYLGLYHVLGGSISPLDGITPENLNLDSLFKRATNNFLEEIIIATNPSIEGNATAHYIASRVKALPIKVSRIATGIALGTQLEYADTTSINQSIRSRTLVSS